MPEEQQADEKAELEAELAAAETEIAPGARADEPSLTPPSLVGALRHHGFELDDEATDDAAASRLEELEDAWEQNQTLRQQLDEMRGWAQQRQAPSQQPEQTQQDQPEPPAKPKRQVPDFDPEWLRLVKEDENGNIIAAVSGVDPTVPGKVRAYLKWKNDELQRMLHEPSHLREAAGLDEEWREGIIEAAYKRAMEEFEQRSQQREARTRFSDYEDKHASWLFTGNSLSQIGALLNQKLQRHIEHGYSPEEALSYAEWDVERETGQSPWKESPSEEPDPPPPSGEETRARLRRRSRNNGSRNRLPQPPVQSRKHAAEITEPTSIGQAGNAFFNEVMADLDASQ